MRAPALIACLLILVPMAPLAAGTASGQDKVLYDTPPWSVTGSADGQMCDARVLTEDRLFELAALKEGALINVAGKDWNFARHVGMMHVVAGEGSGFGMNALYAGFSVHAGTSNAKGLYLLMVTLGSDVETLNIKDDTLKNIATFKVTGMSKALDAWKACADKL